MRSILFALVFCAPIIAQEKPEPAELVSARKAYLESAGKVRAAHEAEIKELAKKYSAKLKTLQEEITKKGDLDGALAVRKEAERVGKGEGKLSRMFRDGEVMVIGSNEKNRTYKISGDRISFRASTGNEVAGRFVFNGTIATVDFGNSILEAWSTTSDGGICVRYYLSSEPNKLHAFGIGSYLD